ncbi:hypothetical protein F2P81_000827 [Scophthalmus maximus]|uniref:Protein kinase domain-containing protein n=1 Tax=Scophthalmus maximus TaxID=52904 RepID=A0A6A4TVM0_SCOMX|nr:hypothetical protein F2P81_000827 [Scophthalmus maximus]
MINRRTLPVTASQTAMEPHAAVGCVNMGSLTSTLPVIPYQKLTDLYYLSRGGFGTVFKAQHSDWRTTVAIKCLKLDSPFGERERNCLLKEAEVLHKARFNYIIQIFGICNEPEFFCIVTEFMSNGSLDLLLHEIADFGLSKWRQLSVSKGSGSKPTEMGGTVIYMPPEEYEPSKSRRADVKNDMYSVLHGMRPDISLDSLPADLPSRGTLISLMTCGWTANPDERPSFLKCLIELEPMVRNFDEIDFLEAVLQIQRSKDTDISLPGTLTSSSAASQGSLPSSFIAPTLEPPESLKDQCQLNNLNGCVHPLNDLNIPVKPGVPVTECETRLDNLTFKPQPQPLQQADPCLPLQHSPPSQGPVTQWIATRREDIVSQMTEACLNQSLDALLARSMLMREDYELVVNQPTRTAKVRQLLDNCHRHNEDFCRIVVRKLHDNKQMGLQPYPAEIASPTTALTPSAPPLSMSYNITRNI